MAIARGDKQPSTPPGRLHSPEPSGTPVLTSRPSFKSSAAFGYGKCEPPEMSLEVENWKEDLCKWSDNDNYELQAREMQHSLVITGTQARVTSSPESECRHEGEDANNLSDRFNELFHKVSGCNPITKGHDVPMARQHATHLQTKMELLKAQLAEEKRQRQIIAQRLVEERQERERNFADQQELWEATVKELQKEKCSLSIRLQELEAEAPKNRVLNASETVILSGPEFHKLRQEIMEQESLIQAYQAENEKAVDKMKVIQADAKEKQKLLAEENASLAAQIASLQVSSRQSIRASMRDSSTRSIAVEAHARELKMRLENEKLLQVIADLERRVTELTVRREDGASSAQSHQHDLTAKVEQQDALISELEAKVQEQQRQLSCHRHIEPSKQALQSIPENQPASHRSTKPMTEQIAQIRSFYIKKVKELTSKLEELGKENFRAEWQAAHLQNKELRASQARDLRQAREQVAQLKDIIKSQEDIVKALRQKIRDLEDAKSLERDKQNTRGRTGADKQQSKQARQMHEQQEQEKSRVDTKDLRQTLVDTISEVVRQSRNLESEKNAEALLEENHALKERLKSVCQELSDLQSICSSSPRMKQLTILKHRIEQMEANHREKEIEWEGILKEMRRVHSIEQELIQRKWELAMEAKNTEVDHFRLELDTILETALKIQAAQIDAAAG